MMGARLGVGHYEEYGEEHCYVSVFCCEVYKARPDG